jgi:hypothetical protein
VRGSVTSRQSKAAYAIQIRFARRPEKVGEVTSIR